MSRFLQPEPEEGVAPVSTGDLPSPMQHAAWRRLRPDQKLALFHRHMVMLRNLKAAGIRDSHPDWSDNRVEAELARTYLHGRS